MFREIDKEKIPLKGIGNTKRDIKQFRESGFEYAEVDVERFACCQSANTSYRQAIYELGYGDVYAFVRDGRLFLGRREAGT